MTVRSNNTDLVVNVKRAPVAGETVTGQAFAIFGGGKGKIKRWQALDQAPRPRYSLQLATTILVATASLSLLVKVPKAQVS